MAEDSFKGSDGFEPPKYLASLIAGVNDGAKAAQAGALFFALVGVYLLATAFSASDEDLLRGRTVTISQIGATMPVSFSFAIAPFVFVFLHIYTLVRYDMLAANVRQFLAELQRTVPWEVDRERCRQLLANVEFIQALVAPPGWRKWVWRLLIRAVIAVFPVIVLLFVQINALRYQSELITRVQQVGLCLDLFALVLFFYGAPLDGSTPQRESWVAEAGHWAKLFWLPAIVMGLNVVYMNVVPTEADVRLVRYDGPPEELRNRPLLQRTQQYLADALDNPLDVVLCPSLKWGCRYLRVDHRTLVEHVWDDKTMADLRRGSADWAKLAAIEGVVLRDRSLRFAVLTESSFFGADLTDADLRKAHLSLARLPGAQLLGTLLQGTNLSAASLWAADLYYAQLQGANLDRAQLQGAGLSFAQLQGTNLYGAQLQGADLGQAQLQGANLYGAQLQGADLYQAQLQGANLDRAQLQGADLSQAQLQGANLSEAQLWRASVAGTTLGLSDLRGADFTTPLEDSEMKDLFAALDEKAVSEKRLERLLAADQSADQLHFAASKESQVLVSDPKNPVFVDIPTDWLITSPTPAYTSALLALFTAELASDPAIASGIASRAASEIESCGTDDWRRSLYVAIACRLLANGEAEKAKIEQGSIDRLSGALRDREIECKPAKPAAPH
jgi:uncharacterized protein YjbI with pentapeptide repeats